MTARKRSTLSRRAFLKKVGAGASMLVGSQFLIGNTRPAYAYDGGCDCKCDSQSPGVLIDLTRCIGCNSCALTCKTSNHLPDAEVVPQSLGRDAYTCVETHSISAADGTTKTRHVKRQCMHCLHAACVAACPTGAMYKSEEGPVVYRSERCMGCRYCQMACPFGIPCFEWDNGTTPVIRKCFMCSDRQLEGLMPACAGSCPSGALRFDQRDRLLVQAHAQIASLPDRYIDHVYGEYEVGGTSMLYLSDVPFEKLGFLVDLPHTAPPEATEKILKKLPLVLGGMATLMTSTALYTHRGSAAGPDKEEFVPEIDREHQESPLPSLPAPPSEQSEE